MKSNLSSEPFAPFQKLGLAGSFSSFLRPIFRSRPKTENRDAAKVIHDLKINHPMRDNVADYFQAQPKLKDLAPSFRVQIVDLGRGSVFRDLTEQL